MEIPVWVLRGLVGYRSNAVWEQDFAEKLDSLATGSPERFRVTVSAAGARRRNKVSHRVARGVDLAKERGYVLEATNYRGPHAVLSLRKASDVDAES